MVQVLSRKACSIYAARSFVPSMLLDMSQSNQFYLVASWVVPSRQGGMDFTGARSIWKCMVMPSQLSMDDTCNFFFECTMGNHGPGTLYHLNLQSKFIQVWKQKFWRSMCIFSHVKRTKSFKLIICTGCICSKGSVKEFTLSGLPLS